MNMTGYISRLSKPHLSGLMGRRIGGGVGAAILLVATGMAAAQNPATQSSTPEMTIPAGYSVHQSVDMGGRVANVNGAGAMYDTLVNQQSGPRVMNQAFEMRAVPGNEHGPFDVLNMVNSGYGGEPYDFTKIDFSKGKIYDFSGMFRRDRNYFDYDLLGNAGIPTGFSIPISGSTTPYTWSKALQSPFMFNTVRRMTDVNLTVAPLSTLTYRFGYAQNIFQGPSLTPSGNAVAGQEVLLQQFQRNSTDDFTGAVDWKPIRGTKLTFEEQIDHYRGDSYFNMAPQDFTAQEADGTKVALLTSYQNFMPYGYNSLGYFMPYGTGKSGTATASSGACNASIVNAANIFYANPNGGLPIIDPACNVVSSYFRSQPTRELFPTEIFRLQSSSIKDISMNGDVRYTSANMSMPNYYEAFQGLQGANRELAETASASAKREVMAADYGVVWQASKTVSLAEQLSFSNVHQPATAVFTSGTTMTVPTTVGEETINYTGTTTVHPASGAAPDGPSEGSPTIGTPAPAYFGQRFMTNNLTVSWDATSRSTFSFTYRYQQHVIAENAYSAASGSTPADFGGNPGNAPLAVAASTNGTVTINENGGIFNAALRPTENWELNGSVEAMYNDNAFTPMGFRQLRHYRVHTIYRPKSWATVSGAFNDLERHNNTNNNQSAVALYTSSKGVSGDPYYAPLDHVDHSRVVSIGTQLFPNDRYGLDFNYSYSDVYMADNACFQGGASLLPGGAIAPGAANPTGTLCGAVTAGHSSNNVLFLSKDFEDSPTQFVSAALALSPNPKFHSNVGYRVSAVNGSRSFTDASDVNGSLISTYQSPFVNFAYALHKNLVLKSEYNYFGYGEGGGQSGAAYCNDNPSLAVGATSPAPVVPCSSVANTAMSTGTPAYGFTAPRNFHANNVTLGVHYEF